MGWESSWVEYNRLFFFYSEYLHQRVLGELRGMEHQSEVWSGAHGFVLAVSPAPAAQQAVADAGRAGVSGGAHFGGKDKRQRQLNPCK